MSKKDNAAAIPSAFEPIPNAAEADLVMFPLRFIARHKAKTKLNIPKY
ncbi:MAG TPA: hypothetical protein VNR65_08465 [Geobacterales bacterium]|nr:hypothetical protein [Geobacterales bacterium]